MKINERRLLTENAVLLQRAQEAEAEAARYRQQNARLLAERDGMLRLPSLAPRNPS